jgi:hypothetical protein
MILTIFLLFSTFRLYSPLIVSTIDLNWTMSYSFPSKLILLDSFELIIDLILFEPSLPSYASKDIELDEFITLF